MPDILKTALFLGALSVLAKCPENTNRPDARIARQIRDSVSVISAGMPQQIASAHPLQSAKPPRQIQPPPPIASPIYLDSRKQVSEVIRCFLIRLKEMRRNNPDICTDPKCAGGVMNTCAGLSTFDSEDTELLEKLLKSDHSQR